MESNGARRRWGETSMANGGAGRTGGLTKQVASVHAVAAAFCCNRIPGQHSDAEKGGQRLIEVKQCCNLAIRAKLARIRTVGKESILAEGTMF